MGEVRIPRRGFICGLLGLVAAPAVVRASSLMPVRSFVDRSGYLISYLDQWGVRRGIWVTERVAAGERYLALDNFTERTVWRDIKVSGGHLGGQAAGVWSGDSIEFLAGDSLNIRFGT